MIVMGRCRCGAALVPELHFCVACGARQDVGARVPATAGAPTFGPGGAVGRPSYPAPRPTFPPSYVHPGHVPPGPVPPPIVAVGAPAPPARSTVPWIVAGVSIVVAVVLVAVGVLAARPAVIFGAAAPTPVVTPTVTVGVPVPAAASSDTDSSSAPTTASTGGSSSGGSSSASASLAAQVAADRSTVEGLVGQWVPQLSSKRDGLVADGITYDDDAILTHYSSLLARDPSAVMLYSGDWSVFNGSDYWVVVHPQGFSTAAAANAWCGAQGYSADDCFAKKLSHSGGVSGTTVQRH
jgi:serine/threonine-protein kinase